MNRPTEWDRGLTESALARSTGDGLQWELLPSVEGWFKGGMLRTNQWGMHDKEYTRVPPPSCHRIALLGASHAMGSGVDRAQTFEAVLEQRLNANSGSLPAGCYEILNFAVYGYSPLVQPRVLTERAAQFQPTAVMYVAHPEDSQRLVRFVAQEALRGRAPQSPFVADVLERAKVTAETPERLAIQRLAPFGDEILASLYRQIVGVATERGMCAAFVFLPMVPEATTPVDVTPQLRAAAAAGFVVLDLSGVYGGTSRNDLWIAEWDAHPNAIGHQLVADRLYALLQTRQDAIVGCAGANHTALTRAAGQ